MEVQADLLAVVWQTRAEARGGSKDVGEGEICLVVSLCLHRHEAAAAATATMLCLLWPKAKAVLR